MGPLLDNNTIDPDLRAHLASLCKNLYLDRDPMIAQIKPNLIRVRNGSNNVIYYDDEEDEREKVEIETKSL